MTPSHFVRVCRWPRRQVYAACASLTASRRNEGPGRAVRRKATRAQSRRDFQQVRDLRGDTRFQQRPDGKVPRV